MKTFFNKRVFVVISYLFVLICLLISDCRIKLDLVTIVILGFTVSSLHYCYAIYYLNVDNGVT